MSKKHIDEILEEKKEDKYVELEESYNINEYRARYNDLNKDIQHIDRKIQDVQNHISNLEADIDLLREAYRTTENMEHKIGIKKRIQFSLELVVKFEEVCQKYLLVKNSYRREQDSIWSQKIRLLDIEMTKISKDSDSMNMASLIQMFQSFMKQSSGNEVLSEIENDLDNDPDYHL